MVDSQVRYKLLDGFDDPGISPAVWNRLLARTASDVVFMTWHWQKAWWEVFGRGELLLVAAEKDGELLALAPLFTEHGMIYPVGAGGSDYLDLIGDVSERGVLENILSFAAARVQGFAGFQFFHVPETSRTGALLAAAAPDAGWRLYDEGGWNCPQLEIEKFPELALAATRKKSLLRHEAYFRRNGGIEIEHLTEPDEILPHLEDFFAQHIARWRETPFPSLFTDEKERRFYRRCAEIFSETGWLRFTRVLWQERAIAYHFGFNYHGNFLWYKPAFEIALARRSPGEVLLRQLLLRALEEKARTFDFGLGEEAFKSRFATATLRVRNWGLYPQTGNS